MMSDGMMPFARVAADARYDLSRLKELLPLVGQHLQALGVETTAANRLQVAAVQLRRDIMAAREAALRYQATQVPT